jgi:hypothetical protein
MKTKRAPVLFVSASLPHREPWVGHARPELITDAVVSFAREALSRGWQLVTAAHPTIAPLLLFVARDYGAKPLENSPVVIYQSKLFSEMFPREVSLFETEGIGRLILTDRIEGELAEFGSSEQSLELMREQLLRESLPDLAVFVGGMEGIGAEWDLVKKLVPRCQRVAVKSPGGAAANLGPDAVSDLDEARLYPALAQDVFDTFERASAQQ